MKRILVLIFYIMFSSLSGFTARAFETAATHAYVYDIANETVLLDKQGEDAVPPASMAKVMTVEMLFEALADGRVQMDTTFGVSDKAVSFTAQGGSTMYLQKGDRPTVADLIKGIIVNSGNDACTVVAEGLAGSDEEFAREMNERAEALGLKNSTFTNSTGWPDPQQKMSMRDLGMLAVHIITTYPDLYSSFAQTDFNYKNRAPANADNRNAILGVVTGADGLKTGHTTEAGYGMVGSVKQGARRIVFAFSGLTSKEDRAKEAEAITNWAFRQVSNKAIVTVGTEVAKAQVIGGSAPEVGLVAAQTARLMLTTENQNAVTLDVRYRWPILAPVAKGAILGHLVIHQPNHPDSQIDLIAEYDILAR